MNENDLKSIEQALGFTLPGFYRECVLNYPFDPDSFGCEFMLLDSPEEVIELNAAGVAIEGVENLFFVGSDGGEQWYFIDAAEEESPVSVFHMETRQHKILDPNWEQYLDRTQAASNDVEADEEAEVQRHLHKKWWEFWK